MSDAPTIERVRIYWTDGPYSVVRTFAEWQALPDEGVMRVDAVFSDGAEQRLYGRERYFWTPEGIIGHSDDSAEEIAAAYPGASIKRGRWATRARAAEVLPPPTPPENEQVSKGGKTRAKKGKA